MSKAKWIKQLSRLSICEIVSLSINLHIQFKLSNALLSDKITSHSPLSSSARHQQT